MLLSFLNKDPISAAQQSGNNHFADAPVHVLPSQTNANAKLAHVPARQTILPKIDKTKPRVNLIEQMCNRTLNAKETERLEDIKVLTQPDASYSPMLTREHLTLLSKSTESRSWIRLDMVFLVVFLMVNSIEDESGQRMVLEILQLLSEYEFVIKILAEIKGQESPVELFKGLNEQPEQIQIEFLRWVGETSSNIHLVLSFKCSFLSLHRHPMDGPCSSVFRMTSYPYSPKLS